MNLLDIDQGASASRQCPVLLYGLSVGQRGLVLGCGDKRAAILVWKYGSFIGTDTTPFA